MWTTFSQGPWLVTRGRRKNDKFFRSGHTRTFIRIINGPILGLKTSLTSHRPSPEVRSRIHLAETSVGTRVSRWRLEDDHRWRHPPTCHTARIWKRSTHKSINPNRTNWSADSKRRKTATNFIFPHVLQSLELPFVWHQSRHEMCGIETCSSLDYFGDNLHLTHRKWKIPI